MFGLPALANDWRRLSETPDPAGAQALLQRLALLGRRGACSHPDGVARFATSALTTLEPEFAAHAVHTCQARRVRHAQFA
jgi:hypothetical protein